MGETSGSQTVSTKLERIAKLVTVNTLFAGMKVTLVERNGAVVDALGGSESGWEFPIPVPRNGRGLGNGNREPAYRATAT